jgi:hypothetical protein
VHEPASAVLFLQYFCMLYLGLHGLVEVLLSLRCSLAWLASLMYSASSFHLDVSVSVHRFSKNIDTTSKFWAPEGGHETSPIMRAHK